MLFRSAALTLVDHRTLWFADDPTRAGSKLPRSAHPRIATLVGLRAGDLTFEVANTHLDHRHEDNRRRQLKLGDYPGVSLKQARQLAEVEVGRVATRKGSGTSAGPVAPRRPWPRSPSCT